MLRDYLPRVGGYLVVASAVATSAALVHREFFSSPRAAAAPRREARYVDDWRQLLARGRLVGSDRSPITIVVFTDFECPFCRRFDGVARQVLVRYAGKVAIAYVHFPLASHRFARPAARAAECAERTEGRFDSMSAALFASQDSLGLRSWASIAAVAGIRDTQRFSRCVRDAASVAFVEEGLKAGASVGVFGTPGVLLNGWYYAAPPSFDELARDIDILLAGDSPYPGMPTPRIEQTSGRE